MYLSPYIKKQSTIKNLSRKINNYIFNNKLTKGAKNLLEDYMRTYSIDIIQNKNMDTKMAEIFCGIFKQISDRKTSYIEKKMPIVELSEQIKAYGGTKRKRFSKNRKRRRTLKRV
jgi:hypothetical protein